MAQPVSVPRWATSGAAVTEPAEPTKDVGYVVAEKPPAQGINWLLRTTYEWIVYLRDIAGEVLTWNALHTFTAGLAVTSGNVTVTDDVTVDGTLTANGPTALQEVSSGLITASEVQLAVPDVYHTARQVMIPMALGNVGLEGTAGTANTQYNAIDGSVVVTPGAPAVPFSIPIAAEYGQRIVGITLWATNVNAGDLCSMTLSSIDLAAGTKVAVATCSRTGITRGQSPVVSFTESVDGGKTYTLELGMSVGSHGGVFWGAALLYDRLNPP